MHQEIRGDLREHLDVEQERAVGVPSTVTDTEVTRNEKGCDFSKHDRQTDSLIERDAHRWINRQTDRKTDRQTDLPEHLKVDEE